MRTITVWLFVFLVTRNASAQANLRPDVPVALVGCQLLDGNKAELIHHSVVVFENGCISAVGSKTTAEILDQFDELGTIEPGKPADIIVIDGNPLADIDAMQHVDIVVKDGGIWYAESAARGPVTDVGHAF